MSLYYPDPELGRFENSVSRLFDDFFKDFNDAKRSGSVQRSNRGGFRIPPLDVHEGDKEFVVNAELPGVTKEQINLDIHDGALCISGETKQDEKYNEGNTHIQERRYGAFSRTITLPRNVKTEEICAKFENGILEVKLPKDDKPSGMKIDIK
ncbi:HSP20-like chaperone [Gigaspora margarita]|uniref:HSP20-like chaperone n=1 Tax=Gigaspora margarita TaxID=4874 RepID=A0A8H4AXL9_GIGMA|nr:HSP20-like chaperone [Gigaspora margarita]